MKIGWMVGLMLAAMMVAMVTFAQEVTETVPAAAAEAVTTAAEAVAPAVEQAVEAAAPAAMQAVESTMIKEVGYDAATQTLTVTFASSNETYAYKNVPEEVYQGLMQAESKGTYFRENIKDKFEFEKK